MRMGKKITITNKIEEIEKIVSLLDEIAKEENIPLENKFNVDMVMDEIITNIISYGYKDTEEHFINIYMNMENRELTIIVEDDGIAFNPLDMPTPDVNIPLEERPIGGLGIYLIKNTVNTIEYSRQNEKNILTMQMTVL